MPDKVLQLEDNPEDFEIRPAAIHILVNLFSNRVILLHNRGSEAQKLLSLIRQCHKAQPLHEIEMHFLNISY
jgi:hypothetical protein